MLIGLVVFAGLWVYVVVYYCGCCRDAVFELLLLWLIDFAFGFGRLVYLACCTRCVLFITVC